MSAETMALQSLQAMVQGEWNQGENRDLWLYRDRTVGLLRRFLHLSLETGRIPSLLGREVFRARVTSYRVTTFEDAVIFVHDVERCLERLDEFSCELIARITLQEYGQEEAARILHCCRKTIQRRYPEALDQLAEIFLEVGLLQPLISEEKTDVKPGCGNRTQ
jgi:predicted DNA-binding protein (UPF0251 family)